MNVFQENRELFWAFARKNTKVNADGYATISRDEDDFNDDYWDTYCKELLDEQNTVTRSMVR